MQLEIARRAEDRMQKEQDRLQMIDDDAIMAKAMKNASSSNFNVLFFFLSVKNKYYRKKNLGVHRAWTTKKPKTIPPKTTYIPTM